MDEVAENSDELMERYLEGEEISHDEIVSALKDGVTAGTIFPVTCGVATKNLGTDRLLDALVQDLPSPAQARARSTARDGDGQRGRDRARRGRRARRLRLQDARRPVRRAHQPVPRLLGHREARLAADQRARPLEGAHRPAARPAGQGDGPRRRVRRRGHRRRREAEGDPLRRRAGGQGQRRSRSRRSACPAP